MWVGLRDPEDRVLNLVRLPNETRRARHRRQSTTIEHNIVAEALDGQREIAEHRAGKCIPRTVYVESQALLELTPDAIRDFPACLNVSRAVFAHVIRAPVLTVEHREQGRSHPLDPLPP